MKLKTVGMEIQSVRTDFSDGIKLVAFLEALSGRKAPRKLMEPKNEIYRLQNISVAIDMAKTMVKNLMVNGRNFLQGTDIDAKLILGFVFDLVLHYQVDDIQVQGAQGKQLTGKDGLLMWCKKTLEPYQPDVQVDDFAKSWQDGLAFVAIAHAYNNDCISYEDQKSRKPEERMVDAFQVIQKVMDVEQILDSDFASNPSEKANITYLSLIYRVFQQNKRQVNSADVIARLIQRARRLEEQEELLRGHIDEYDRLLSSANEELQRARDLPDDVQELTAALSGLVSAVKRDNARLGQQYARVEAQLFNVQRHKQAICQSATYSLPEGRDMDALQRGMVEYQRDAEQAVAAVRRRISELAGLHAEQLHDEYVAHIDAFNRALDEARRWLSGAEPAEGQDAERLAQLRAAVFEHDTKSQEQLGNALAELGEAFHRYNQARAGCGAPPEEPPRGYAEKADLLHEQHLDTAARLKEAALVALRGRAGAMLAELAERRQAFLDGVDADMRDMAARVAAVDRGSEEAMAAALEGLVGAQESTVCGYTAKIADIEAFIGQLNQILRQLQEEEAGAGVAAELNAAITTFKQHAQQEMRAIRRWIFEFAEQRYLQRADGILEAVREASRQAEVVEADKIDSVQELAKLLDNKQQITERDIQAFSRGVAETEAQLFALQQDWASLSDEPYAPPEGRDIPALHHEVDGFQTAAKAGIEKIKARIRELNEAILQTIASEIDHLLADFNNCYDLYKQRLHEIAVPTSDKEGLEHSLTLVFENDRQSQQELGAKFTKVQEKQIEYNQTMVNMGMNPTAGVPAQGRVDEMHQLHDSKAVIIREKLKSIIVNQIKRLEEQLNNDTKVFNNEVASEKKNFQMQEKEVQKQKNATVQGCEQLIQTAKQDNERLYSQYMEQINQTEQLVVKINLLKDKVGDKHLDKRAIVAQLTASLHELRQAVSNLISTIRQKMFQASEEELKQAVKEFNDRIKEAFKTVIVPGIKSITDPDKITQLIERHTVVLNEATGLLNAQYQRIETLTMGLQQLKQQCGVPDNKEARAGDDSLQNLQQKIQIYQETANDVLKNLTRQLEDIIKKQLEIYEQEIAQKEQQFANKHKELIEQLGQLAQRCVETEDQIINLISEIGTFDKQGQRELNEVISGITQAYSKLNQKSAAIGATGKQFDNSTYTKDVRAFHDRCVEKSDSIRQKITEINAHECRALEKALDELIKALYQDIKNDYNKLDSVLTHIDSLTDERELVAQIDGLIRDDQENSQLYITRIEKIEQAVSSVNASRLKIHEKQLDSDQQLEAITALIQEKRNLLTKIIQFIRKKIIDAKATKAAGRRQQYRDLYKQFARGDPEGGRIRRDELEQLLIACDQIADDELLNDIFGGGSAIDQGQFERLMDVVDRDQSDTSEQCCDAFRRLCDGEGVTERGLLDAKLKPEDVSWLLKRMRPVEGAPGKYSFKEFVDALFQ